MTALSALYQLQYPFSFTAALLSFHYINNNAY